ncbi:MAG: flagellar basal body L-ring protein FlgH [Candidatus Eremiobacteraeota bacterium]|nr:flagellar basal body L-ring protein FlgH [Candidatus Eremiobacteraeota bacterium]
MRLFVLFAIMLVPSAAFADTLYVAPPPPSAPGHPLRLTADHRAAQIGDLVAVQFNFNVQSSSSDVTQNAKNYNIGLAPGTGNAALSFLRFPTSIGGQTGSQSAKTKNGSNTFATAMMATVVNVLPSGVLQIQGDQQLLVNGENQTLRVSGYVRPEDIDATDNVLSSRIANVNAFFMGDFQEKNKGLIRKILDFLF